MNFNEALNGVKQHIATLMTKENISDKEIEDLTQLTQQVDELGKQHQELVDNHTKMKDKYIEAVVGFGTTKQPKDEVDGGGEKTFEQIASEVIAKGVK